MIKAKIVIRDGDYGICGVEKGSAWLIEPCGQEFLFNACEANRVKRWINRKKLPHGLRWRTK